MKTTMATAAIAAMVLTAGVALAAEPVCGDVNNDSSVKTADALLVLRKSVSQPITLSCAAYEDQVSACQSDLAASEDQFSACQNDLAASEDQFSACQSDLAACEDAPVCGNEILDGAEECEAENLGGETCVTQGFAGGTLKCAAGCIFDTDACYLARFESAGDTIIDHQTGLEWEKKDNSDAVPDLDNPHDADNKYQWSTGVLGLPDGGAFTSFVAELNGALTGLCYSNRCDWRLPTMGEMATFMDVSPCGSPPCIVDAAFLPTQSGKYSTSTVFSFDPTSQVVADFSSGIAATEAKTSTYYVRAVRKGVNYTY
jgi:hypothetical protein